MMVKGDPKTTAIQDVPRSIGADGTVGWSPGADLWGDETDT